MKHLDKLIIVNESCLVLRNENGTHRCIWVVSHSTWVQWNRGCNRKGDCFPTESSPCCRCTALWSPQSVEDPTSPCGCALPCQGLGMTALKKHTLKYRTVCYQLLFFILLFVFSKCFFLVKSHSGSGAYPGKTGHKTGIHPELEQVYYTNTHALF